MYRIRFLISMSVAAGFASLSNTALAQSSLARQQERCDELRAEVEDARRELDRQESRAEAQRRTQDTVASAMRQRGKSDAQVDLYQRNADMVHRWGGSEENARRSHRAAVEAYQMQGCSTGGYSTYNYEVD